MYHNEADALNGMNLLDGPGWQALAACDPDTGMLGIHIYKNENTNLPGFEPGHYPTETCCEFEWPMYGQPLKPEVHVVTSGEELLAFLRAEPEVWKCDAPKRLQQGFISYRRAPEGIATIYRFGWAVLSKLSKADLELIKAKRQDPPASRRVGDLARAVEASLAAKGETQTREAWLKTLEDFITNDLAEKLAMALGGPADISDVRPVGAPIPNEARTPIEDTLHRLQQIADLQEYMKPLRDDAGLKDDDSKA